MQKNQFLLLNKLKIPKVPSSARNQMMHIARYRLDDCRGRDPVGLTNHHLHVTVASVECGIVHEDLVMYCQLYSERRPGYVSER